MESPTKLQIASSLAEADVGKPVIVDQHGRVLDKRARRAVELKGGLKLGVIGAIPTAAAFAIGGPIAAGLVLAGFGFLLAWSGFALAKVRRAHALFLNGRREEAYDLARAIDRPSLAKPMRISLHVLIALLELYAGRYEAALARCDGVLDTVLPDAPLTAIDLVRAASLKIQLLALLGRLDEARALRPRLAGAQGEYGELLAQGADLAIAFHAGDPASLPADETLHDWAKVALGTNLLGGTLIQLAWVFEQRGDLDMAKHLVREAPTRLALSGLPASNPALQQWFDDAQTRFGPAPDED